MTIEPDDLLGRWTLERTIDDRLGGRTIIVDGTLALTADRDGITWHEDGTMLLGADRVPVRRTLLLRSVDGAWTVSFDDGRPFHPWVWGTDFLHDCPPDAYAGRLDGTPDRWTVRWDVTGPSKDHTIRSVLRPEDGRGDGRGDGLGDGHEAGAP